MISRAAMKDRVDVLGRHVAVASKVGTRGVEHVVAADVRCLITTSAVGELASILGMAQTSDARAIFGKWPAIQKGYRLRVHGTDTYYTVDSVERQPSPSRVQMQVASLSLDTARVTP